MLWDDAAIRGAAIGAAAGSLNKSGSLFRGQKCVRGRGIDVYTGLADDRDEVSYMFMNRRRTGKSVRQEYLTRCSTAMKVSRYQN